MNYSEGGQLYLGPNLSSTRANATPHKVHAAFTRGFTAVLVGRSRSVTPETNFSGSRCQVVQISNKNVTFHKGGKYIFGD